MRTFSSRGLFTHTKGVPSRARSAVRRAGHLLRSVRMVDAGAREACFIAPDAFSVLYTRRTREDAFSVPRLSIYTIHRSKVCVCSKFFQYTGHGRRTSFTAPWVFTVLWRAGRERSRLPFRARSAIHRAGGFIRSVARWTRESVPAVLRPSSFCGFLRTWNVRLLRLDLYKYSEFTGKEAFAPGFAEKPKGGTLLCVCSVWKRNGKGMSGTGGRIARCDGFFF